ncbi:hypothetical protein NQ315_003004 [Exocentrus adspersus]|uniref:Uncharacterized protein n=1 Tax=Exocentrus adspersus TaxID=1586481 RepID=A0AAV8W4E9_9CUCU|nr:hypothetical protein NQ315_003004 [Exocentrus adspersus]
MKENLAVAVLCICASLNFLLARPQDGPTAEIVQQNFVIAPDGKFFFNVSTSDGFQHKAKGEIKKIGTSQGLSVEGEYFYISSNGEIYTVTYTADERGFIPSVKLLPPSILRTGVSCVATLCGTGLG